MKIHLPLACLLLPFLAPAAELPPLPPGPLPAPAGSTAQWQLAFSYPDAKAGAAPKGVPDGRPLRATVVRTGSLWHATLVTLDNASSECWGDGTALYGFLDGAAAPIVLSQEDAALSPYLAGYGARDFPGTEWISPQSYVAAERAGGVACAVFRRGNDAVWINAESGLPVQAVLQGATVTFTALTPPSEALALPPSAAGIAKTLKYTRDVANAQANRHP